MRFESAEWRTGTKDDKVYVEMWAEGRRVMDFDLQPDQAYGFGQSLIDHAIRQGYKQPKRRCCEGGPQWGHSWDCQTLP